MMDLTGNVLTSNEQRVDRALLHSVILDEGYLQVAAHVDDTLKRKIQNFEYVDFARLLPQDRVLREEDHHLTFINKGGVPYLVPASDSRDGTIGSYSKWDQAFRVYSEIITEKYPLKAQKLIQYNHVIHTAAQTYIWENVYSYDKDFRIHISHNPLRTWSVILQQAWTMKLKERLHEFNASQSRGQGSGGKRDYCRRFQRGTCNDGVNCRYEHRCTICNKFGHGAHICRKRTGRDGYGHEERGSDHECHNDRFHYFSEKEHRGGRNYQSPHQHHHNSPKNSRDFKKEAK